MIVAFDLDGTLDNPAIAALARVLVKGGHEVHVITGEFDEAGDWQNVDAKLVKLARAGLRAVIAGSVYALLNGGYETDRERAKGEAVVLHVLHAVDHEKFDRDYRLADLGLRKGALTEKLGIELIIDDSELYCKMIPSMNGGITILRVC